MSAEMTVEGMISVFMKIRKVYADEFGRMLGNETYSPNEISILLFLANNPAILIMDDTTSAVDMETEEHIQQELKKLDGTRTIITIAHRISSVKDADMIVVLDHGKIIERGTHAQLVAAHGRYWEIYRKQLGFKTGRSAGFETKGE